MSEEKTLKPRYEDLSPTAQEIIRKKSTAAIFFASLIVGIMGAACFIEGFYILFQDEATLLQHYKTLDFDKGRISCLMMLFIGLFGVLSAIGTIHLSPFPYKMGFYITPLIVGSRFVDAMVFQSSFITFGTVLNLALAVFALMFLFAGRYAVLLPPPTLPDSQLN